MCAVLRMSKRGGNLEHGGGASEGGAVADEEERPNAVRWKGGM